MGIHVSKAGCCRGCEHCFGMQTNCHQQPCRCHYPCSCQQDEFDEPGWQDDCKRHKKTLSPYALQELRERIGEHAQIDGTAVVVAAVAEKIERLRSERDSAVAMAVEFVRDMTEAQHETSRLNAEVRSLDAKRAAAAEESQTRLASLMAMGKELAEARKNTDLFREKNTLLQKELDELKGVTEPEAESCSEETGGES